LSRNRSGRWAIAIAERLGHERPDWELPVGPFVAEPLRDRDRAPDARVDRRRAGEQRTGLGLVAPPGDLAGLTLEGERVVDRPFDHRPEVLEEPGVAGEQVVVPHAIGDVAGDVRVGSRILHVVAHVVGVPAPGLVLHRAQPLVGPLGLGEAVAEVEGHGGLDEVPRVAVLARGPRDVAVGELDGGDRVDGGLHLLGRDDAGDGRNGVLAHQVVTFCT
jgi:hypothetical protein